MIDSIYSYGLLAIELCPGQQMAYAELTVAQASQLAEAVAGDLKTWIEPLNDIDISVAGVAYDPVEILRPGWPLHQELAKLSLLAPKSLEARVMSIGANTNGMPDALRPHIEFQNGPLRLIPYVLSGPATSIAQVQNTLEEDLMERGMASASTALLAQELFSVAIEHARYMTLHDLVALMAMQYNHNGLEPVWPIIETALLAPQKTYWLEAPPEPLIFFEKNTAHIAMLDYHQWALLQPDAKDLNCEQFERQFQMFQMRQRQIASLLEAHGLEVNFDFCPNAAMAKQVLQS
ncbi:MAG TPA: hypothetical protein VN247_08115 [Arenimonas sp.]|nr:hypothetical protein [Arenimonas sp.]